MLETCLNLPKLRKTLATLPTTLDDTYARILCNIDDEYQQYALHILQWLAFSMRPLHLKEVAELVAIDINDHPKFDPQRRLPDPEDVVEICSSLITVTESVSDDDEFNHLYSESYGAYVTLAHFSVYEYLISDIIPQGRAVSFKLDKVDCHVTLTKDCLAYLFHFDRIGSLTSDVFAEYPLAQYAAAYLPEHAQVAERKDNAICQDLFLTKGEAFRNWVRLHDLLYPIELDRSRLPRSAAFSIYYAWEAGLSESVRVLITKCAKLNAQDEMYENALIASSYIGNNDLVRLLLEERFHLDTTSSFYGIALRSASSRRHTELVQILLERGPAETERANLALRSAIENHAEEEAQSLIENGVDSNYANTGLLELALEHGLPNIADLILDKHGAHGEEYTQALVEASRKGHHHIVQILLDRGAVIDAEVMQAAMDGEILQLILDRGGNPALRDAQGRALCHHAAAQGSIATLEMLAKLGSDLITMLDKQGRTCLHHAVTGRFPVYAVVWLLDKGLDVNIKDRDGWTPLHWAARCGYMSLIDVLQDAGAKFCRENIMGWSPNDVALFQANTELWGTGTASNSESKGSKPDLEDGSSTANPKAITRDIGGLLLLGSSPTYWFCNGCNTVSHVLIALRVNCANELQDIRGARHSCMTCLDSGYDFDYCFKCRQSSDVTHSGHTFILAPN